jgi:nitrous oxidase accessory protein
VDADDCEIRGLIIDGTGVGRGNEMDAAIRVTAHRNLIVGNRIRRAFYGIVIAGGSGNVVQDNTIEGLINIPFGRRGDGIYVYRSTNNHIAGNRISAMRDAIYFQYAPGGIVERNQVSESRYGLHDMFSDGTSITNNEFRSSAVGANLMNSKGLTLRGNRFIQNRGISAIGLALKDCDGALIADNRFAGNGRGLQLDGASNNRLIGNEFLQNDVAIRIVANTESNVFSRNVFAGNWNAVVAGGRGSTNRWASGGIGNEWSGYAGFDFDGDGVGELPHPLAGPFEQVESRNPFARLFLQSPAAGALALAARLSAAPAELTDPFPITPAPRRSGQPVWPAIAAVAVLVVATRPRRLSCSS